MRKKGIATLAVFIGIIIALSFIFTDRWLEKRLEAAGAAVLGARVEIDNLDFSLFGLHVRWDSLQAANPENTMKNIMTTGPVEFNMQLAPLFRKKIIIDNIAVTNMTSGTDRTSDGKIEKRKKAESHSPNILTKTMHRLEENIASAPVWNSDRFSNMNLDSLLQKLQILSPQKIDSLQDELTKTYALWDSAFAKVSWKDDFRFLDSRVKAIKPDEIKTLEGLETAYQTLEKVGTRVDSLATYVKKTRTHLNDDLQEAALQAAQVDDWIQADYKKALAQARLPRIDKTGIARMIFGDRVTRQTLQVLSILNGARSYSEKFASDKPKKEKPPRMKGQTIYFTGGQRLADFWIKNVKLSGMTQNGLTLDGRIQNIVSNQKVIGAPTTFVIKGDRGDGARALLSCELNYLGETPQEQVLVHMSNVPIKNVKLSSSEVLTAEAASGRGSVKASLMCAKDTLSGSLEFKASEMSFHFEHVSSDPLQQAVQKIMQNTKAIDVSAVLESSNNRTQLGLHSNLDEMFSKEIKAIAGAEIENIRSAVEARVQSQVAGAKQRFDGFIAQQVSFLETEMSTYEDMLSNQNKLLQDKKKQMDKRIAEEKKKAQKKLEGKAKKKLKGLFDN